MPMLSRNPATEEVFAEHEEMSQDEVARRIDLSDRAFQDWRKQPVAYRADRMRELAAKIRERMQPLAEMGAREMGRPVQMGINELKKCADLCEYYADNTERILAKQPVEGTDDYVRFDPLGVILAVMPWNFPYWQAVRFLAPGLMAGNVALLKHASNVQGCATMLENLFFEAGFPTGCMQNLAIPARAVEAVLTDRRVKAATLTGSEKAGSSVGAICGREIKPVVLELGGNDAFIVLEDADLEKTADVAITARLQNSGQSCIAAKRFIVHSAVSDRFTEVLKERFETRPVIGDPLDPKTTFGPLATEAGLEEIEDQVQHSVDAGARILTGGHRVGDKGFFYAPTILVDVTPDMPVAREETFGPVAAILVVDSEEEAIRVANDSDLGLGASVWTADHERGERICAELEAGFTTVNTMVISDKRVPFGGIKKSGVGRELAHWGMLEFVNVKTVRVTKKL